MLTIFLQLFGFRDHHEEVYSGLQGKKGLGKKAMGKSNRKKQLKKKSNLFNTLYCDQNYFSLKIHFDLLKTKSINNNNIMLS